MDYEKEIRNLSGETLALQTIIVALSANMVRNGSDRLVAESFDAASSFLEDLTIKHGGTVSPEHLAHSLRVVEKLRTSIFRDHDKPKHGI